MRFIGAADTINFAIYKITYNGNGADEGSTPDQSYRYGEEIEIAAPQLWKDGKQFSHWATYANGSGATFEPGDRVSLTMSSFTLYAQWKDPECALKITGNCYSLDFGVKVTDSWGYSHFYSGIVPGTEIVCYPGGYLFLVTDKFCHWTYEGSHEPGEFYNENTVNTKSVAFTDGLLIPVSDSASGLAELSLGTRYRDYSQGQYISILMHGKTSSGWVKDVIGVDNYAQWPSISSYHDDGLEMMITDPWGYRHIYNDRSDSYALSIPGAGLVPHYFPGQEMSIYATMSYAVGSACSCYYSSTNAADPTQSNYVGSVVRRTSNELCVRFTGKVPDNSSVGNVWIYFYRKDGYICVYARDSKGQHYIEFPLQGISVTASIGTPENY